MYVKPKKSLGQNFLVDKNIVKKIIDACQLKPSDIVLEIGAGQGELTGLIANNVGEVYALEMDQHLCEILRTNLEGFSNVTIINQDILEFNLKRYFCKLKNKKNLNLVNKNRILVNGKEHVKVIGNIPYYITTPIIEYLLKFKNCIDSVFITVQKEFAKRITAKSGSKDYGSFSCFIQYYTEPKILFTIKKTCFLPPPKVDSSFMQLKIRPKPLFMLENERLFFKIIRSAFNKRRKMLKNSLEGIIPPEKLNEFFSKFDISHTIRPEELTLEDFANLAGSKKLLTK